MYIIVLVLTLFGILYAFSPESKDCSNYYNAKLDTNTDLIHCCKDANRRPMFQEINIDSGTTLFSCMCLPNADARDDVGDEDDDDNA
ncbi:hypothetical protein PoB_006308100 [Plakobranchus ocellatus]|uniref:Uncharacterized protein n=1 Tax=Plakobranchus ocellatus TaxID=259542 RepID=A0AAV4CXJ5_9GAST|nr:hypothetical protein PoB_006308100 [Plakobranchus ocellatus]